MLLNYIKLSLRQMARNPFFTAINVAGLSIGLASFYILWQYATHELLSDRHHADGDRIARIGLKWSWTDDGGKTWGHEMSGAEHAFIVPRVKEDFPEVEETLRVLHQDFFGADLVNHEDKVALAYKSDGDVMKVFKEEKVAYSDPNLFNFFTIPLVYGNADDALRTAGNVALSKSTAEKYFGRKNPVNEVLVLNDSISLNVAAVFEDLPRNSHLNFEVVLSNIGLENKWESSHRINTVDYVKLVRPQFSEFEAKLNSKVSDYFDWLARVAPNGKVELFVQPLHEIAFSDNFEGDRNFYSKSKPFLLTLAFIALAVLVMAWINYINLVLNRVRLRYREIATRKTNGASGADLFKQFLTEAATTNILALMLGFTILQLVRLPVLVFLNIYVVEFHEIGIQSAAILTSIVAGGVLIITLYPYRIATSFRAKEIFARSTTSSVVGVLPTLLTTVQVSGAVVFIVLGFVIALQLNHVLNLETGISKEEVVVIDAPISKSTTFALEMQAFKQHLSAHQGVSASALSHVLFDVGIKFDNYTMVKRIGSNLPLGADKNYVDQDFIPFYGIAMLAGREFVEDEQGDVAIISNVMARRLGFKNPLDALNARIHYGSSLDEWKTTTVIGVFEDYRLASFIQLNRTDADGGRGIILKYKDQQVGTPERLSLRISMDNVAETMTGIEKLYKKAFPGNPFVWYFLEDWINRAYLNERASRNQVATFTILAIGICCLGLIGTMSNKVAEQLKEIGIRKILGASLVQITQLLLKLPASQMVAAVVVGIPIAYYLTDKYLQKFSERVELSWWHYMLPVAVLSTIMLLTTASILWKAAKNNPVEALKHE